MKFDHPAFFVAAFVLPILFLLAAGTALFAQTPPALDIPCPSDEPCQILVLTKTEASIFTGDNGILATAAQARSLDLGQFVSYFRQKIALAPAGKNASKAETKPPEAASKPETPELPKK